MAAWNLKTGKNQERGSRNTYVIEMEMRGWRNIYSWLVGKWKSYLVRIPQRGTREKVKGMDSGNQFEPKTSPSGAFG